MIGNQSGAPNRAGFRVGGDFPELHYGFPFERLAKDILSLRRSASYALHG